MRNPNHMSQKKEFPSYEARTIIGCIALVVSQVLRLTEIEPELAEPALVLLSLFLSANTFARLGSIPNKLRTNADFNELDASSKLMVLNFFVALSSGALACGIIYRYWLLFTK